MLTKFTVYTLHSDSPIFLLYVYFTLPGILPFPFLPFPSLPSSLPSSFSSFHFNPPFLRLHKPIHCSHTASMNVNVCTLPVGLVTVCRH
ncbi:MAG: hypothetical protein ACK55Z_00510, partial [bacterium]